MTRNGHRTHQVDLPDEGNEITGDDPWGDEAPFRRRVLEVDSHQAFAPRVTMVRYQAVPGQLEALARVLMSAVHSEKGDE